MTLDLAGYTIRSGLINAHDHLEFNLFPRQRPLTPAWSRDITGDDLHWEQLKVPAHAPDGATQGYVVALVVCITIRTMPLSSRKFSVRVVKRFVGRTRSSSVQTWRNATGNFPKWPFIVHLGEAAVRAAGRNFGWTKWVPSIIAP